MQEIPDISYVKVAKSPIDYQVAQSLLTTLKWESINDNYCERFMKFPVASRIPFPKRKEWSVLSTQRAVIQSPPYALSHGRNVWMDAGDNVMGTANTWVVTKSCCQISQSCCHSWELPSHHWQLDSDYSPSQYCTSMHWFWDPWKLQGDWMEWPL